MKTEMYLRFAAALLIGAAFFVSVPGVHAADVVVINTNTTGTYGNDTANTLYLRPLNNAMLGNQYFGSGYPHENYAVIYTQPQQQSGIQRANEYLASTAWMKERQALLAENAALRSRIASLEEKLIELDKRLKQMEAQQGAVR